MKINCSLRTSLLNQMVSRQYPRDLDGTPEIDIVVREQIHLPVLEHAARAKAYGVQDRFLFASVFVPRDEDRSYNRTSLDDVQAQGYLLGDALQPEQVPPKVYRVIPATEEIKSLTIPTSGAVFTFYTDCLS